MDYIKLINEAEFIFSDLSKPGIFDFESVSKKLRRCRSIIAKLYSFAKIAEDKSCDIVALLDAFEDFYKHFKSFRCAFADYIIYQKPKELNQIIDNEINEIIQTEKLFVKIKKNKDLILYCAELRTFIQDSKARLYFGNTDVEEIVKELANTVHLPIPEYIKQISSNSSIMRMMNVVDWVEEMFPVYMEELSKLALIELHEKYGSNSNDMPKAKKEINSIIQSMKENPQKDFNNKIINVRQVEI